MDADLSSLSGTELEVAKDLASRQIFGIKKYKTTLRDAKLSPRQLMQHEYEERLDGILYLKEQMHLADREWTTETPRESGYYWWKEDETSTAYLCVIRENKDSSPQSTLYEMHFFNIDDKDKVKWSGGLYKEATP